MSPARRSRTAVGRMAELAAVEVLRARGYDIVERNYRSPVGEIDIVAKVDDVLTFVEVRARTSDRFGTPAESVDFAKRRRLTRIARHYIAHRRFRTEPPCRFDVVAIGLGPDGEPRSVEVIQNAFQLS